MRTLVFFILGVIALPCFSMTKVDLYHTEVPLNQDLSNPEQDAEVTAMKNVIIKMTGDTSSVDNDVIKKALDHTSEYVSSVGYKNLDMGKLMKVDFNVKNIRTLITQSQLAFWPEERPTILVWYIQDTGYKRSVVWQNDENDSLRNFQSIADLRGLPVIMPVGDIQDITSVQVSDLWGGFVKPISQASERYSPDAVLVVKASDDQLSWTLYDQTPDTMSDSSSTPMTGQASGDNAAVDMVDTIAGYYAHKSGIVIAGESALSVELQVNNLDNAMDFFKLETKLKALSTVASIDVQDAHAHDVTYKVNLLATRQEFENELQKITQLKKDDAPADTGAMDDDSADDNGNADATDEQNSSQSQLSAQPSVTDQVNNDTATATLPATTSSSQQPVVTTTAADNSTETAQASGDTAQGNTVSSPSGTPLSVTNDSTLYYHWTR